MSASPPAPAPGERWARVNTVFHAAVALPRSERAAFVRDACPGDDALRADVQRLVDAHDRAHDFIRTTPFADIVARVEDAEGTAIVGQRVGAYRLVSLLGRGGMGAVYLAERADGQYAKQVAIKLCSRVLDASLRQLFADERQILAGLDHHNIARLVDGGATDDGIPYFVMEYVDGEPIDRYAARRRLDLPARLALFQDVLAAVAYAHANLVVHRDLKPSNVFVGPDGQVKLLDFGIAKLVGSDGGGAATQVARDVGLAMTPAYAAPEQVTGQATTTRTDVYALGVLLFELLSGRHPFYAAHGVPADLLKATVDVVPPKVSHAASAASLRRALSGDLDAIVTKALQKAPQDRYESVGAFTDDLARYLASQPVRAHTDSMVYRTRKWFGRHKAIAAVGTLAIAGTLAGLGVALWQAREAQQQRDRALSALARSEAVTEFYHFLLADAGPPDAPQTINGMIARSESLLKYEFAQNPEHQAAILVIQASYYLGLGNAAEGEPRARRAVALVEKSTDSDIRASAACVLGYAMSLAGKVDEGIREVEEGLRQPQLSPATASACHSQRAYIAQNMNDGAAAERHALAALDLLRQEGGHRSPRTLALARADLGYAQQLQGHIGDADKSFAASIEQLTRLGLEWTPVAGTILNNWGIAVLYAGDVRRALDLWERALKVVTVRDPAAPPPGYLLSNLARANEQVGRFAKAQALYEQTTKAARASGNKNIVAYGLNGQSTVHLLRGDLDGAEALFAEAKAATATLAEGSPAILNAELLGGRLALARGRFQEAWETFTRLQAVYDAQPPNPGAAGIRVYLSEVALKMGRPDAAATLAEDGVQRSRALQGGMPYSRAVGLGLFALAKARHAQGRSDEARQATVSALEHLQNAIGTEHPVIGEIQRFQADLATVR